MTFGNDNWSSLRFVCANVGRPYWLLYTPLEHGWLMLVYGTLTRCRPWKPQNLWWGGEWRFFPFFLVRLCAFIPTSNPVSSNSQYRILFIRRIVQIWYQRIGDAEGEIIVVVNHLIPRCWIYARENGASFGERKAGKGRRSQKENELLFYSWSYSAIRWNFSSHSTST